LAISLLLHTVVLSQFNWNRLPAPTSNRHALTVNLEPAPSIRQAKISPDNAPHPTRTNIEEAVDIKTNPERISSPAQRIETPAAENTSAPTPHLDMNHLLNQARENTLKELRFSTPAVSPQGNYSGVYTGLDKGIFFFHLDGAGRLSGSGISDKHDIVFAISGNATSEGLIEIASDTPFGIVRLMGRLHAQTGKVSGKWAIAGVGDGAFSGQRE
jgi:hypothetical protein